VFAPFTTTAKEEILSPFPLCCADPALASCMVNLEKPHQGVAAKNPALHPGITWSNSTTALGLRGARLENRIRSRCTGKERDSESGLDMFGARYYGSSLGRFMTPDWAAKPIDVPYADFGNPQSLNLYSYVKNNPTTTRDPDGHVDPVSTSIDIAVEIATYIAEHPEEVQAVEAEAEAEAAAGVGASRWGLLAGPALFIGEMINPHTTVGGDKPQTQPEMSKGGKQNKLDSGFINLTNDEVNAIAKDKNDPRQRRAQTEQKARGIRNKQKRDKQPAPAPPKPPTPPPPTDPPPPPPPPPDPPKQQ